jgi:hypothetical protein
VQTHLVSIVPDIVVAEETWTDWATRNVKENGWKAAGAAVVAAPIIPAAVGTIAVGAGLVSGVQNGFAWLRGADTIEKLEYSKAGGLRDEHGLPVQVNVTYAVHPDVAKPNSVVVASEFHHVIVREQIADLVAFIRSAVRAVAIRIEVESEGSGKAEGSFFSRFSLKADGAVTKRHSIELEYDDPRKVEATERPYWLRLFPEIVAAFNNAERGTIKRSVSVDTTFGLSASLAKQAGIDLSWLGRQRFDVEAKFI